jgi:hypothetical protein
VRFPDRSLPGCVLGAALAGALGPACSLGQGSGQAVGVLDVPTCWQGPFDLKPDFFAAIPTTNTAGTPIATNALQIRVQNGGDYETFSDGLSIVVDDLAEVRGDATHPGLLGQALVVSLPAGVRPVGVPITPMAHASLVHATLYLGRSCRTQNVALYATDAVSLNPDGSCGRPDGGDPPPVCPPPAVIATDAATGDAGAPEAGLAATAAPVGASSITFHSLFDGNPDESNATARFTDADFHFYLADPREICAGGLGLPPRCRGELTGKFSFYFQRGKPAQAFP